MPKTEKEKIQHPTQERSKTFCSMRGGKYFSMNSRAPIVFPPFNKWMKCKRRRKASRSGLNSRI